MSYSDLLYFQDVLRLPLYLLDPSVPIQSSVPLNELCFFTFIVFYVDVSIVLQKFYQF